MCFAAAARDYLRADPQVLEVCNHWDELFPPLGSTGMVWGGRDLRKHQTPRASPANTWLNYNTWM